MTNTRRLLIRPLAVALLLAATTSAAWANLLVDAGFEDPDPIDNFGQVVGPPFAPGFWGAESGNKAGAENGVTPLEGLSMLHLSKRSDEHTQAWQAVDLSSFAALIDSGSATLSFHASYNTPAGSPGKEGPARALATLFFFDDGAVWPNYSSAEVASLDLDDDDGTWEQVSMDVAVPVNTRWVVAQVHYVNSSLTLYGGYVDDTSLEIPEPASLVLLSIGTLAVLRRRH